VCDGECRGVETRDCRCCIMSGQQELIGLFDDVKTNSSKIIHCLGLLLCEMNIVKDTGIVYGQDFSQKISLEWNGGGSVEFEVAVVQTREGNIRTELIAGEGERIHGVMKVQLSNHKWDDEIEGL
jgi:hypothetical protein